MTGFAQKGEIIGSLPTHVNPCLIASAEHSLLYLPTAKRRAVAGLTGPCVPRHAGSDAAC